MLYWVGLGIPGANPLAPKWPRCRSGARRRCRSRGIECKAEARRPTEELALVACPRRSALAASHHAGVRIAYARHEVALPAGDVAGDVALRRRRRVRREEIPGVKFRTNSATVPWNSLVPDFVTVSIVAEPLRPYWAPQFDVSTRTSACCCYHYPYCRRRRFPNCCKRCASHSWSP